MKRPKRYLTLLFSDQDLKITKLDKRGNKLTAFFESPLPEGLIVDGEVKDPEKLGQYLLEVKAKFKLKDQLVVVGLSEQKASTHSLVFPNLTPEEINSAIKFQADSFLPFPYPDEYLDWMLIDKTKNGKSKILLSAVPKKIVDGFTAALEKAGFQPIAFETTSLSLLRLLPPEGKKLSFAAELGETAVVLILGLQGTIEACSVIQKPQDFLQTLQKMTNFYFPEESPQKRPGKIYLCGKNISQNLLSQIKQELKIEPIVLKTNLVGIPENRRVELAILISLAKKEVAPPKDIKTLNILPQKLIKKYQSLSLQRKRKGLIALVLFLFVLFNAGAFFGCFKLKAQNDYIKSKINIQKGKTRYQKPELMALGQKAKLINVLEAQKDLSEKILAQISAMSSPQVEILGFNFDATKGEVIINGRAETRSDLLEFKKNLEEAKLFDQVFVPLSALEKEKEIEFRVTAGLKH